MVATTFNKIRPSPRWCWCCIGLLASAVLLLLIDEFIVMRSFGASRGLSCPDGKLDGGGAQLVCITEHSVVKVYRPCENGGSIGALIGCKLNYWHQMYVNNRWEMYAESALVPDILSQDKTKGTMLFERIILAEESDDVTPDYKYNMEQLLIFDEMLRENGHIACDLAPRNVPRDDSGKIHMVDFMLIPTWMRGLIESRWGQLKRHSRRREGWPLFSNMYGTLSVMDRIVEGGMDSDLTRQATEEEKGSIRRGLRRAEAWTV